MTLTLPKLPKKARPDPSKQLPNKFALRFFLIISTIMGV
jgi:hypothetical protein